jgi:uncharacterized membrane protein YbhN (UPF0104 family)
VSADPTVPPVPTTDVLAAEGSSAGGGRLRAAWTGWPGRVARVSLMLLPLAWLSRHIEWTRVAASARRVGPGALAVAFGTLWLGIVVAAVRWRVLLRAYGADPARIPRVATLLRHYMVGQYFSVLPTGIAGDAVRGYRVAGCLPNVATSYVVLFVERVAGLLGLLGIASCAALASPGLLSGRAARVFDGVIALALVCGLVVFALPQWTTHSPRARAVLTRVPVAGRFLARMPASRGGVGPLAVAFALSILTHATVVATVAILIAPLAPTATLAVCARVVPAIVLVTFVPLTPGGLGQREGAFVYFFSLVHVPWEPAIAASLLYFAVFVALALAGGLVLLYERARGWAPR